MRSPGPVTLAVLLSCLMGGALSAQAAAQACASPQLAFGGASGTPVTTTHAINVTANVVIGDVFVGVRVDHGWVGDVHLELTSPAGTMLVLQSGQGGNADDLDLIFADAGVPHGAMPFDFGCHMQPAGGSLIGAFLGESSQGTWTVRVTDDYPASDDGVLERWCLSFFTAPQVTVTPPVQGLACAPAVGGGALTWINAAAYSAITVFVDGAVAAQLPGAATAHVLSGHPNGTSLEVEIEALSAGSAPSCRRRCTLTPLPPLPEPKTEKLVFVLIDGLRYSEGLGDPTRTFVPRMGALAAQGTIIEPFLNDDVTVTSRAVPAVMCGSWDPPVPFFDSACSANNQYSSRPTFYESFRQQRNRPATDCQYIVGAFCPWRGSFHPSYGSAYWPHWAATSGADNDVWAAAQTIIANDAPSLLTVYLDDVDSAGHSGSWPVYTNAIQNADQIVGDLWDLLQSDPEYAGRTTMIVTNDHGRHWYDFTGHGDGCTGCRTMQFLAVGPPIRRGHVSTVPRAIPDVAPTVGALLGFHTEYADGAVMSEIFANCQADLGLQGPGDATLAVCGEPLASGQTAHLYFRGGPASGTVHALVTATSAPAPILGGTFINPAPEFLLPLPTTAAGTLFIPDIPGGLGAVSAYLQVVFADAALVPAAPHIGFSNAVRLDFLP